jgi:splicing factor 3B subunit 3
MFRYLSCALHLDYDSMAGADKFGNIFLTRMPADISLQVEDDPTGGKFAATGGMLNAADNKVNSIINFHVGDLVMSMQLTALQAGGQEVRPCVQYFHKFVQC